MKLIWRMMWATENGLKTMRENGEPFITNEYHDKILNQAVEQGKKDGHHDSFRTGVETFGQELRKIVTVAQGLDLTGVTIYELERLLETWNVPEEKLDA